MAERSSGTTRDPETWEAFRARIEGQETGRLRPRDLKRLVAEIWEETELSARVPQLLDGCVTRDRSSIDRVIVQSYLAKFPTDHAAFRALTAASAFVANRRNWPWKKRGESWSLWIPDVGPNILAQALLASDDPRKVLRESGLSGDLGSGAFVSHALLAACKIAGGHRATAAETSANSLITLLDVLPTNSRLNAAFAFALLHPWESQNCSEDHRRRVSNVLVRRIGDPRLAAARWSALRQEGQADHPHADFEAAFAVLRRWLVQATVRQFFAVVAKTTDRQDQWAERTAFWLGYLDAGVITDAWFAFGSMAERLATNLLRDESVGYARIEGAGADASHSALLFTLGDLRIAEWSHNGRTRFWRVKDRKAPPLYQKIYYAMVLRAMDGGAGFEALSHVSGWQWKFARHIHNETGIRHPKWGKG